MISIKDLKKTYLQGSSEIHALAGVSFDVAPGQTLAIVGPSGSGKTTLLSTMTGLEEPSSGELKILENDIVKMAEKELSLFRAQNIGIIFQQFHLMPQLTAIENVSLPLEILGQRGTFERAARALEQVGLSGRESHLPQQLSGGECQRVAIARAIVGEPKILFADEPSGNLDQDTGEQVMQLIFDLVQKNGMTLVLVTHDRALADRCQKTIELKGGRLQ